MGTFFFQGVDDFQHTRVAEQKASALTRVVIAVITVCRTPASELVSHSSGCHPPLPEPRAPCQILLENHDYYQIFHGKVTTFAGILVDFGQK